MAVDDKEEFFLTIGPGGPAMHRLVEEELAALNAETVERFGQARFFFSAVLEPAERFSSLRAPEKLYVLAMREESATLQWPSEREAAEAALAQRVAAADWDKALRVWRRFAPGREGLPRSFRVTGKRAGKRGAQLSSNGIAEFVGEALADTRGWQVDLYDYDLEVVVHLNDEYLIVFLPLLERGEAQQAQFALPGLSQPVAWAMARSVEPALGDIVVDPMCGSGIVLFEAAQCWRGAQYLGFDMDSSQLERSSENLSMLAPEVAASLAFARGDACRLPLANSSVDAVVCDLPFGKQYGTEADNVRLYPAVVAEFWRVLRPRGRAVLLTNQANAGRLAEAFADACIGKWRVLCRRKVLLGHMEAVLFLATRLDKADLAESGKLETKDSMRLPWEDKNGRRTWSSMKASLRQPMRAVAGGKKSRR